MNFKKKLDHKINSNQVHKNECFNDESIEAPPSFGQRHNSSLILSQN